MKRHNFPVFVRADWMNDAECRKHPDVSWFPDDSNPHAGTRAKAICNTQCPVQAQCLQHAITWPEEAGIWGGVAMRRHWRKHGKGAA